MVKEKELTPITSWQFAKESNIDIASIKEVMGNLIEQNGYEVKLEDEKITAGSLFNPVEYESVKIVNPNHQYDYFYYCVGIVREKKADSVNVYIGGKSSQQKLEDFMQTKAFDGTIKRSIGAGIRKGGSVGVGMAIGGATVGLAKAGIKGIAKGIAAMSRNQEALDAENAWYEVAQGLIVETFNPNE